MSKVFTLSSMQARMYETKIADVRRKINWDDILWVCVRERETIVINHMKFIFMWRIPISSYHSFSLPFIIFSPWMSIFMCARKNRHVKWDALQRCEGEINFYLKVSEGCDMMEGYSSKGDKLWGAIKNLMIAL